MSRQKIENTLYYHTKSLLNGILPLEYAIRAFRENDGSKYDQLISINDEILRYWIDRGFSEEEVHHELLMDLSWDLIQVGLPLSRTHGRVNLNEKFLLDIRKTASEIQEIFGRLLIDNYFPFVDRYRVVDLINGNNIGDLAKRVIKAKSRLSAYEKDDSIPIGDFALGGFREAIRIYPGMLYQYGEFSILGESKFGMGMVLDFGMSLQDVDESISEFLYQYGKYREGLTVRDDVSSKLIQRFLVNYLDGRDISDEIKRIDSILGGVLGLYCYDQVLENKKVNSSPDKRKKPLENAITCTINLFPVIESGIVASDSIKKYYQKTKGRIKTDWNTKGSSS